MKYILLLAMMVATCFTINAQQNAIKLLNLQINDNPLIPIDGVTGQPSDTLPRLYHLTLTADDLTNAVVVYINMGTTAEEKNNLVKLTASISNENGMKLMKLGRFTEPVQELPAEITQANPGMPKYILRCPVELTTLQAQIWKYAEVYIEDSDKKNSVPAILTKP